MFTERKPYESGMVIGRFQMFHNGHKEVIDTALALCDRVVVYIGSSQEFETERNPFSYQIRKEMIEECFQLDVIAQRVIIKGLPDIGIGNNESWGRYVLDTFKADMYGTLPDLYVTGCEKERASWFSDDLAPNMNELRISRNTNKVSGTYCRQLMIDDDFVSWKKCVPFNLYKYYKKYRDILVDWKEA